MAIPGARAVMRLTPSQIKTLSPGAAYRTKDKTAAVTARKTQTGMLEVTADCDSLNFIVESLYTEVYRLRQTNRELTEKSAEQQVREINRLTGWQHFWIKVGKLSASILFIYFTYKAFKRRLNGK